MSAFLALLARDVRLGLSDTGALMTALGFNLIVVSVLPLGLGPDLNLLARIAPGILWIALLLSVLLTLDRLFHQDQEDGSLDALALGSLPLEAVAAAKCLAHWLTSVVPLIVLAPALGLMLNLDVSSYPALLAALLIGTPALSFLGAIGAALTLGLARGGLLLTLLILPLYLPTLIFGVGAVSATMGPGSSLPSFLILAALSLASLVLGPLFAAMALRAQLQ